MATSTLDRGSRPASGPVAEPDAPAQGWIRRLFGYCLRHKRDLYVAFGAAIVSSVIAALVPLVERQVIDDVTGGLRRSVLPFVILLIGAGVARFATSFTRRYTAGRLSLDVQYDMRNDVFASLEQLDGAEQDALETGQVVSRSITDITLVQGLLAFLPNMVGNFLLFIVSLVIMVLLSPTLTLVALAVGPALYLVARASRRDLFPANWAAQQQSAEVAAVVESAVTGVRVVKGFGQEARELSRLEAQAQRLFANRMRVVHFTARYAPALQSIPALGQVGVLAVGGYLALHGQISLGTFLAFSTYLGQLVSPVRQLAALLTIGQQARSGIERVVEVIDAAPDIVDDPAAPTLPDGPLSVELDGVTFGYTRSRPVLREVSLSVQPGETLALVGTAGSGKSTVSLLLPRFYDVHSGTVRVGGQDVRDVRLTSLRSRIGVVFEDSFLFSTTVAANIAYGRPEATEEQIRAAARAAQAEDFITALPDGYDTVVGEQGLTLSGGQRQRVALARAVLADPQVLLLDDATSAIDARVEAEIHETLRTVMRGRTTLLIAHRRSTLSLADRIAVLDGGRVVDVGSYAELEARCQLFRLLLTGPGADAEGIELAEESAAAATADLTMIDGVTPALWPAESLWADDDEQPDRVTTSSTQAADAGAIAVTGRTGGRRGGGGGFLNNAPASPALLAKVAKLPPADAEPDVDDTQARAADPRFGLRRLLRPLRWPLLAGLGLVLVDAVAQLAIPALVRTGIDVGVTQSKGQVLALVSVAALAIVLTDWLLVEMPQQKITGRTGERLLYTLRVKTFAQLQRLGLDFYERELGGRIMTRMTTDVDALSNFLQTGLTTALVSILTFIGVLVALVWLDAGLALVLVGVLPVLAVATWLFRAKSGPAYTEAREKVSVVNASLQENVAGVRVAQAFNRAERNGTTFRAQAFAYRVSRLRAQKYIATYFPFVEFLSEVSAALVLAVGASRLQHGTITAGVLIAFLLYVDTFFAPVQQLSQVFDGYQQARVGLARLSDLLRTRESTPEAAHPRPVPGLTGRIELRAVHFAYAGASTEALSGVNLVVEPGETVALVGETGAGKSTVVKLVARFYDATRGAVLVDGQDLRELDMLAYRQRLGVVPQEAYLFSGTVRDAIAYGRPSAGDAEVEAAARAVGAHEMIAGLSHGYLTAVGERGRSLSAGQRQLLALARAALVDPDILLLDEATAALDMAAEDAVNRATDAVARSRTTLVVAHRLTTAARADRVVVLDHGKIVEQGRHEDLVDSDGPYARLWAAFTA